MTDLPPLPATGQTVTFPGGTVAITTPLQLAEVQGGTIEGNHTTLVYTGPPTRAVLELARCGGCQVRDLEIVVAVDGVDAAVLVTNLPGTSEHGWISTHNQFSNVVVRQGGYTTSPRYGFSVNSYAAGGADGNNDLHQFRGCTAESYVTAGFHVNGSQCHQLNFSDCRAFNANGWGGNALFCEGCVYFRWVGGGGTGNDVDFRLTNAGAVKCIIEDFDSENAKQFLVTGRQWGPCAITMRSIRWEGKPEPGKPVLDCDGTGPYRVAESYFAGTNGVCPTLKFDAYSAPGMLPGAVDLFGVLLRQHGGTGSPGIIATVPVRWEVGSRGFRYEFIKPDGSRVAKPGQWNRPIQ